jgi:hypothetical protein
MTELTVATRQALFELQKRDGAVGTAQRCCLNAKQEYITMEATAQPNSLRKPRAASSFDTHHARGVSGSCNNRSGTKRGHERFWCREN